MSKRVLVIGAGIAGLSAARRLAKSGAEVTVIDGQPKEDVPHHHRPINTIFQNYAIVPHLNVHDNIADGLQRLGLPKAKQDAMVAEMLEMIALPGYDSQRRVNQLSGGQMQRVALARALILQPKVLLLDEPLGALHKQLREQMQLELRLLQQRLGITFILVTHDREDALTLSDRVAVMAQGRAVQVDTPAGLYERPKNRTVACFIGSMNVFPGTVHRSTTPEIKAKGLGRLAMNGHDTGRPDGAAVTVAIRPEKMAPVSRAPEGPAIKGVVQARQCLGGRHMLHVAIAGRRSPLAVAMQVAGTDMAPGQQVWVTWQDDAMLILDADEAGQTAREMPI